MDYREKALGHIGRLDARTLSGLTDRSLYLTADWSSADLEALVTTAETFEALDRANVPTPLFPRQLFYSLFFDNSTTFGSGLTMPRSRVAHNSRAWRFSSKNS